MTDDDNDVLVDIDAGLVNFEELRRQLTASREMQPTSVSELYEQWLAVVMLEMPHRGEMVVATLPHVMEHREAVGAGMLGFIAFFEHMIGLDPRLVDQIPTMSWLNMLGLAAAQLVHDGRTFDGRKT